MRFIPKRWPTVRAFGTNPLVRVSDRIEAIVVVSAVAISLLAAPIAGAIGTTVHDARSRVYAEQAHSRQPIKAIVATTTDSAEVVRPYAPNIIQARWFAEGVEHADTFSSKRAVTVGDEIDIWVDDTGERVAPPMPASQAAVDAVWVGILFWLAVVGAAAALVAVVRWRVDCRHETDWEREIRGLADRRWAD
ncbi:Rv1733c family protein [Mycobacterium sp. 4D054]|uniref:Rv1733c family protein n=1 Tax=Mycobacterium sp. 4D054 TaxID=3457440 RepID=UPI003FD17D56